MSSDIRVVFDEAARLALLTLDSKPMVNRLLRRIDALRTFPQTGQLDQHAPKAMDGIERRISYVSPYAIRYEYNVWESQISIVSITDERAGSYRRFL